MRDIRTVVDGAFTIRGGKIGSVGTTADILRLLGDETQILDAGGKVVTPGLVDAHTHLVFEGTRADEFELRAIGASYAEIASRGGGIRSTVAKTRAASEESLFATSKRHADWMLRNGTTTAEVKSGYGLSVDDELRILRVARRIGHETPLEIVPTLLAAHAVPQEYEARREAYVNLVIDRMIPMASAEGLAEYCDVFVEPGYFEPVDARRISRAATDAGMRMRLHADQLTASGGAELAAELRVETADHLEQTGFQGIAALSESGVKPVLLPGSVYALGLSRYADARAMIDAGLPVVIATDFNPGSSPLASMPMAMSLACTQMRMTPAEALIASTVNAAHAIGRGGSIGTLESNKRANFVLWDCEDWREIPYWIGAPLASAVFVDGQRVVFDG
jgi:imidazolonepropionase